jgi:hypothetical protein
MESALIVGLLRFHKTAHKHVSQPKQGYFYQYSEKDKPIQIKLACKKKLCSILCQVIKATPDV